MKYLVTTITELEIIDDSYKDYVARWISNSVRKILAEQYEKGTINAPSTSVMVAEAEEESFGTPTQDSRNYKYIDEG